MLGNVFRSRTLSRFGPPGPLTRFASAYVTVRTPSSASRGFASSQLLLKNRYDDARGFKATDFGNSDTTFRPKGVPTETLWVGNLPYTTVKEQLENMFEDYGTLVSVRLATRPDGEFRGFAHIEYPDAASAEKAFRAHNENQFYLDGRSLVLDYASPRAKPVNPPSSSIYVGNYGGDEILLENTLQEFKDVIQEIKIMRNPQTGVSYRYGFIRCAAVEEATKVLDMWNGKEIIDGETLQLSYARSRNEVPRFTSYDRGQDRVRGMHGGGRRGHRRGDFEASENF